MKTFAFPALLALALLLPAPAAQAQQTIECRSFDRNLRECRVPWGRSEMVRQTSSATCIPNTTWGERQGMVWVTAGCSAVFREARGGGPGGGGGWGPGSGDQVTCESPNFRRRECRTNNWSNARLVRQISNTRCEQGRNWDIRRGVLWVDQGCAGVFAEARGGSGGGWGGGPGGPGGQGNQQVRCDSPRNGFRECQVGNNWRGARLVRQTSNAACVEGRSWGFNRGRIWVDRGCAGVFEAGRGGGSSGGSGGWSGGSGGSGRSVSCNSRNNGRQECRVDGWRDARLVRQTSRAQCIENRTWGFRRGMIWVDNGCAGEFVEGRR
jgi:hypothetical protein